MFTLSKAGAAITFAQASQCTIEHCITDIGFRPLMQAFVTLTGDYIDVGKFLIETGSVYAAHSWFTEDMGRIKTGYSPVAWKALQRPARVFGAGSDTLQRWTRFHQFLDPDTCLFYGDGEDMTPLDHPDSTPTPSRAKLVQIHEPRPEIPHPLIQHTLLDTGFKHLRESLRIC